jgi:hypothetical protein
MGLSFTIVAGLASAIILRPESRGNDHILLSQIRDSPNLEGQVPVFISPGNRAFQLYPQALGSLFVASYYSQGYGGGIRSHLHTGTPLVEGQALLYDWRFTANQFVLASSPLRITTRDFFFQLGPCGSSPYVTFLTRRLVFSRMNMLGLSSSVRIAHTVCY